MEHPIAIVKTTDILLVDKARRALAEARSYDDVKDIRNRAEAMRAYARHAKDKTLEIDAVEIRLRAERRLGEMMKEQKEIVGFNTGERGQFTPGGVRQTPPAPTLAEAGIDKNLAKKARSLVALPPEKFEEKIIHMRESAKPRVTAPDINKAERKVTPESAAEQIGKMFARAVDPRRIMGKAIKELEKSITDTIPHNVRVLYVARELMTKDQTDYVKDLLRKERDQCQNFLNKWDLPKTIDITPK